MNYLKEMKAKPKAECESLIVKRFEYPQEKIIKVPLEHSFIPKAS